MDRTMTTSTTTSSINNDITDSDSWDAELRAAADASISHDTDITLFNECRKCEQGDPTYRYDDCPIAIIDGSYREPAGYYAIIDGEPMDPECRDCYKNGDQQDAEPVGYWHETDFPVHCVSCDALLVTTLTPDGVEWVRDAIVSPYGRANIKAAWEIAFADELSQ